MDRPRLVPPYPPHHAANVLIASGLPWHVSEARATVEHFSTRFGKPRTVRAYEDNVNGSSRGIFFIEYAPSVPLEEVRDALVQKLQSPCVAMYYLTNTKWNRSGRLPELPVDVPTSSGALEGYGPEGFMIRCGPTLGLPNTVLQPEAMEQWRKRWRDEAPRPQAPAR